MNHVSHDIASSTTNLFIFKWYLKLRQYLTLLVCIYALVISLNTVLVNVLGVHGWSVALLSSINLWLMIALFQVHNLKLLIFFTTSMMVSLPVCSDWPLVEQYLILGSLFWQSSIEVLVEDWWLLILILRLIGDGLQFGRLTALIHLLYARILIALNVFLLPHLGSILISDKLLLCNELVFFLRFSFGAGLALVYLG